VQFVGLTIGVRSTLIFDGICKPKKQLLFETESQWGSRDMCPFVIDLQQMGAAKNSLHQLNALHCNYRRFEL
jgi:hypothetical protein